MPKFKIGDKIRVVRYKDNQYGRGESLPIGSVHIIAHIERGHAYTLEGDKMVGDGYIYHESELEYADNALQKLKERYAKV